MFKVTIVIFLVCLCLNGSGQQSQSALTSNSADVTRLLPEKILVHADKDFYICGEIMWFKLYVVNATSNQLQTLSKTAYVEISDATGNDVYQAKVELKEGTGYGSFQIPLNVNSGNYQLRAYTNWMKNHPSSILSKDFAIVNTNETFDVSAFDIENDSSSQTVEAGLEKNLSFPSSKISTSQEPDSDFNINIISDKNSYQQRSPATFEISSMDNGSRIVSDLSVSVYKVNEVNLPKGFLESNFQTANSLGMNEKMYKSLEYPFLPEMNGYIVAVKVQNSTNGNIEKNVPVLLSVTGKIVTVKSAESDENGIAYFNLKNIYGPHLLLLKTTPAFENKVDLTVMKPYLNSTDKGTTSKMTLKSSYLNSVEEMHNHMIINKEFNEAAMDHFYPENPDSISFYGKPYKTYLLDNYKRFVTMEEVFREYVQEINVRIRNNDYYLPVFNRQYFDLGKYMQINNMMNDQPPLALIDGVPVTSLNKVMKYDPLKIRKIEIVADRYFIGKESYDGIISLTTYNGEFEGLDLNNKDIIFDDDGWHYHRKFFIPDYRNPAIKNNRIPDFRELLYWSPEVRTSTTADAKISFYTGDLTGKFVVVVRGVSDTGKFGNATFQFEVVK